MVQKENKTYIISPRIRTKNNLLMFSLGAKAYNDQMKKHFPAGSERLSIGFLLSGKYFLQPVFDKAATLQTAEAIVEDFLKMSKKQFNAWLHTYDVYIETVFRQAVSRLYLDPHTASVREIAEKYLKLIDWLEHLETYSAPIGIMCFYTPYLPDYLRKYLRNFYTKSEEAYTALTRMEKMPRVFREEKEWVVLAKHVISVLRKQRQREQYLGSIKSFQNFLIPSGLFQKIQAHCSAYAWMGYVYNAPGFTIHHFIQRMFRDVKEVRVREGRLSDFKKIMSQKRSLVRRLGIDAQHMQLFRLLSEMTFHHTEDQTAYAFLAATSEPLMKAIGRRFGITAFEARYLLPEEVRDGLHKKIKNSSMRKKIRDRIRYMFLYYVGDKRRLFAGKAAKLAAKKIFGHQNPISILRLFGGIMHHPEMC